MFGPPRDRPRALAANLGFEVLVSGAAGVDVGGFGGLGDNALELRGADQVGLTLVPRGEDFGRWGAAQDPWVDESREADAGDMAGGAEYALEVPDGLCGLGVDLVEEAWEGINGCRSEKVCWRERGPACAHLRRCLLKRHP